MYMAIYYKYYINKFLIEGLGFVSGLNPCLQKYLNSAYDLPLKYENQGCQMINF